MSSKSFFKGKRIFISGACGTIGSEIIKQLVEDEINQVSQIIGIDNNESALFYLEKEYETIPLVKTYLSDIRDKEHLLELMEGVDIVLHTAALKHVHLCESSPSQAVATNITGLQNIITSSNYHKVKNVIFTSSDKAVNPTNVMGTTKLTGERLISAANQYSNKVGTKFSSTRFGNILGSNGSVIPIFKKQIKRGGPITLTNRNMTRFVMTIEQAVKMVLTTTELSQGGEVFVTKMPAISIKDLAIAMIDFYAPKYGYNSNEIEIREIGNRPGEKLYEELLNQEETRRTIELKDYFCVLPAFKANSKKAHNYQNIVSTEVTTDYSSSNVKLASQAEITDLLLQVESS